MAIVGCSHTVPASLAYKLRLDITRGTSVTSSSLTEAFKVNIISEYLTTVIKVSNNQTTVASAPYLVSSGVPNPRVNLSLYYTHWLQLLAAAATMDLLHLVQGPQEASRSRSEFRRPADRRRHGSGASRSTESGWHMAGARRRYQTHKYFWDSKNIFVALMLKSCRARQERVAAVRAAGAGAAGEDRTGEPPPAAGTVQYSTVQYSTVQYSTIQYTTCCRRSWTATWAWTGVGPAPSPAPATTQQVTSSG